MRAAWGVVGGIVGVIGAWRAAPWLGSAPVAAVSVSAGDIERGRHLATSVLGCAACHGEDLGGGVVASGPWHGTVVAPNLTPSGPCGAWTPEVWAAVLRSGRSPDGRLLRWMPSWRWSALSEADLADVVAWLDALPAAEGPPPQGTPGPGAWLTLLAGPVTTEACADGCPAPPRAPDAAYGAYLGGLAGCSDCHGAALQGHALSTAGRVPRPGWTGADFARAVITDGDGVAHAEVPTADYARLELTEIDALWQWARGAAPAPTD